MKGKIFVVLISLFVGFNAIAFEAVDAKKKAATARALNWLANTRPVREVAIFKNLPGAITRCHIAKSRCTQNDRTVISQALKRIPFIMGAVALATGITFAAVYASKHLSADDFRKIGDTVKNKLSEYQYALGSIGKTKYKDLAQISQKHLSENLVTAVTKDGFGYVSDILSKVILPLTMLNNLLIFAAQTGSADMVELLVQEGARPNAKDAKNNSLIYWAARRGISDAQYEKEQAAAILKMLLARGVDVNTTGEDGRTPIMFVAGASFNPELHTELIQGFLNAGANLAATDLEGKIPADYAQEESIKKWLQR